MVFFASKQTKLRTVPHTVCQQSQLKNSQDIFEKNWSFIVLSQINYNYTPALPILDLGYVTLRSFPESPDLSLALDEKMNNLFSPGLAGFLSGLPITIFFVTL